MNEVDKEVLYKFVELHKKYPGGDVLFLWVQAGGKVASQQTRAADALQACGNFRKARDGKCFNCGCDEKSHR